MPLEPQYEFNSDGTEAIYVLNTDNPSERHLTFLINKAKRRIYFFPRDEFIVKKVELKGFTY
jgi:hypothetical protein